LLALARRNFGEQDNHFIMVCDGHAGDLAAKKVAEMMPSHIKANYKFDPDMPSKERRKIYAEALFDSFLMVDRVSAVLASQRQRARSGAKQRAEGC